MSAEVGVELEQHQEAEEQQPKLKVAKRIPFYRNKKFYTSLASTAGGIVVAILLGAIEGFGFGFFLVTETTHFFSFRK